MKHSAKTNINMNSRKSLLPPDFYEKLFEAENKFQSYPSMESCERLLLLYKQGAENFGDSNSKEHTYFINSIQKIMSAQMTTKILTNKSDNKSNKKYHTNIKNQVALYNLEQYDYKPDIKNIIEKCENSMKKSLDYLNKISNIQKTNFRKNIRKKIFKSRFEKINEDEEEEIESESMIFNSGSKTKNKNELIFNEGFTRKRQRFNSISRLNYRMNNFLSLSQSSFFNKPKRRISINSYDDENNNNNNDNNNNEINKINRNTFNRTNSQILDDYTVKKIPKKSDFHPKQDLSEDLIQFLKNYSVKLHYLFQTPLNETLNKLNNILDKNYVEMKNQYFEYEENVKGYLALCEDPNQEPFKTLIESLKTEFNESLFLINTEEEQEIKTLIENNVKNNLVDMISISNLNDDTIAQIAEIFK